jgi:hypothetical protein
VKGQQHAHGAMLDLEKTELIVQSKDVFLFQIQVMPLSEELFVMF